MMFADTFNALRHLGSKDLLAIAVAGDKRSNALPDVAMFAVLGCKDIVAEPYFAMHATHGTPLAIRKRLLNDIREVLKVPEVAKRLNDLGVDIGGTSPKELDERMKSEYLT